MTLFTKTSYTMLLLTALIFTGCGSKTTQEETNASSVLNTSTETTGGTSGTGNTTDNASSDGGGATEDGSDTGTASADVTPPTITLKGKTNITLTRGDVYKELGATAVDDRDGDVNVTVTVEGSVDTLTEGTYTVTYTATDKAGNVGTVTRTVTVVAPTLTNISLESNVTTLNVGETAEVTVLASYSDGSTSVLGANVAYVITPSDSVDVNGSVLTAKKDGNVTVQAKVNGVLSNTLHLTIVWIVNGHTLPPEPDKALNDSTLLGIDVNDNGVRDDVERWIYKEYKDKHPIYIDIAMQASREYKKILETPEKAKEIHDEVSKADYCQLYYMFDAKYYNEPILIQENAVDEYFRSKIYFNTKDRYDAYIQYDTLLSGDSYTLPKDKEEKAACDFNTSKYK